VDKFRYTSSHPWITFKADLKPAPPRFWLLLGQASALCERIARAPVRPQASLQMHKIYFAKGVLATTAIEGNTLSEEQVQAQLSGELELPPSKEYLKRETENVIGICNEILDQILSDEVPEISAELVCDYNRRVLSGLELEQGVIPGEIPTHSVVVGNVYRGAPREDCMYLLNRLASWVNSMPDNLWDGDSHTTRTPMAIVKAVLAHLYIAWIHPFGDGNGRTARLVEFLILAAAGVPSPAAHLLSNHYNETRTEYYRVLDQASKTPDGVTKFLQYAAEGMVDGLQQQLETIHQEHLEVAWESYVFETFKRSRPRSDASSRQRDLVLDLSRMSSPVPRSKIVDISPRIAREYATKTSKTVSRDLNVLFELNLIRETTVGIVANVDTMLGFMPVKRSVESS
jgi:cell filamentation protein, protein adenylyltransferase